MKKTIKFSFVLIALFLVSCYYCNGRKLLGTSIFSQAQKESIPYQTNQKIRFLRENSNDTTTFIVGSISNQIEEGDCGPECCDYYLLEHYRLTLDADYPQFKLQMFLSRSHPESADTSAFGINIYLNSTGFYINHPEIKCVNNISNRKCFDSLTLNNKVYYDIIESSNAVYDSIIKPINIKYNRTNGILQFQLNDSTTYTLLP